MVTLKVKKLSPTATIPTYGTEGSAAFDLYYDAPPQVVAEIGAGDAYVFATNLAFGIPVGYVLLVYSRSGMGFKQGLRLVNGTGIIDQDYTGHLLIKLRNDSHECQRVRGGDRIAQAILLPLPKVEFLVVEELDETARGSNGFGSTGA